MRQRVYTDDIFGVVDTSSSMDDEILLLKSLGLLLNLLLRQVSITESSLSGHNTGTSGLISACLHISSVDAALMLMASVIVMFVVTFIAPTIGRHASAFEDCR